MLQEEASVILPLWEAGIMSLASHGFAYTQFITQALPEEHTFKIQCNSPAEVVRLTSSFRVLKLCAWNVRTIKTQNPKSHYFSLRSLDIFSPLLKFWALAISEWIKLCSQERCPLGNHTSISTVWCCREMFHKETSQTVRELVCRSYKN